MFRVTGNSARRYSFFFNASSGPLHTTLDEHASELGGHVHIVEKKEWRRGFAERMGYTSSPTAEDKEVPTVFDATGSAAAMAASLAHVAPGGKLVFVGLTRDPVCIDDSLFHRKEVTLLASRNSFGLFPRIIHLIEQGKIDTSPWVTDRLKLSDVISQFQFLPQRETLMKAIVDVNGCE